MNKNKLYCTNCKNFTTHRPKLSAVLSGSLVCNKCSKMNGFCTLTKVDDEYFEKRSKSFKWVEFDKETLKGKCLHETPEIGHSLIMSPFNAFFSWQTTTIKEIVEESENKTHFKTENSDYILYFNKKTIEYYEKS